jgi:two-component system, OmpR family, aerobic respiration control protein ArcA
MKKKINIQTLVEQIEKITKEKIAKESLVSLDEYRKLKRKRLEKHNILVIEDDETMRKALAKLLESEGYKVITAADGTQLEKIFGQDTVDLILLDVGLPWVNGFELTQVLKSHEDLKEIPIVLITGLTNQSDLQKGLDLGAETYLKKPFDVEILKSTISNLLKVPSA